MMKWQTPVAEGKSSVPLRVGDEIMVLGSCFADETGRRNGRGAYLCRSEGCLNKALKIKALDRALEQPLSEEAAAYLRQVIAGDGNEAVQ